MKIAICISNYLFSRNRNEKVKLEYVAKEYKTHTLHTSVVNSKHEKILIQIYLLILEVLQWANDIGLHSLLARFPAGWTNLTVLIGVLECLNQTQSLVYGSVIKIISITHTIIDINIKTALNCNQCHAWIYLNYILKAYFIFFEAYFEAHKINFSKFITILIIEQKPYLPTGRSLMVIWRKFCLSSMMKRPRKGIPDSSSSTP